MHDPISGKVAAEAAKAVAPIVYKDTVQPAAKEIGKSLETIAKTVRICLTPLSVLVWGYEQTADYVNRRVAEKLAGTPEERIQSPPPNIAGPAVDAIRFAGSDDLREMYASLLATAMDSQTTESAHPAFVEVIRQLTPDEARIVRLLVPGRYYPVINIFNGEKGAGVGFTALRHFSLLGEQANVAHTALMPSYLDNLVRLGIAEMPAGRWLTDDGAYDDVEKHPEVARLRAEIDAVEYRASEVERRVIGLTSFGVQFVNACVLARPGELGQHDA